FDTIKAQTVALANQKLYVNREEGFIGTGLKKDEFLTDCSDLDEVIVFREDGKMVVSKVAEKTFVGKNIIHLALFKKNDERTTYHMIYRDGKMGNVMVKRFNVTGVTRDKEYDLTKGSEGSKVLYFTVNPNGESEIISVDLHPNAKARIKEFEYNFAGLDIKGRSSQGNILTKYAVKKIKLKEKGKATIVGTDIWFDDQFGRLNTEQKGKYLGKFESEQSIIAIYNTGNYEITDFQLTNRYDTDKLLMIEKFDATKVVAALYFDGESETHYIKRFNIETQTLNKKFLFITEAEGSKAILATTNPEAKFKVKIGKKRSAVEQTILPSKLMEVKGWKAIGNKLTGNDLVEAELESNEVQLKSNTDLHNTLGSKKAEKTIQSLKETEKINSVKPVKKVAVQKEKPKSKQEDLFSIPLLKDAADVEWEVKPSSKKSETDKKKVKQNSLF
ncbi:MAG: DNA gyrase/topoisomerase IV subunit A, partial [Pseudomonadota bacterium]